MMNRDNMQPAEISSTCRDTELAARVALVCAGVTGEVCVADGIEAAGGAAALVAAVHDGTDLRLGLTVWVRARIRSFGTGTRVAETLESLRRLGVQLLIPGYPSWPVSLGSFGRGGPLLLWAQGDVNTLAGQLVAMTGPDTPSVEDSRMTLELSTGLTQRGWTIAVAEPAAALSVSHLALRGAAAMRESTVVVSARQPGAVTYPSTVTVGEVLPGQTQTVRSDRRALVLLAGLASTTIQVGARPSLETAQVAEAAYGLGRPVGVAVAGPVGASSTPPLRRSSVVIVRSIDDADRLR